MTNITDLINKQPDVFFILQQIGKIADEAIKKYLVLVELLGI